MSGASGVPPKGIWIPDAAPPETPAAAGSPGAPAPAVPAGSAAPRAPRRSADHLPARLPVLPLAQVVVFPHVVVPLVATDEGVIEAIDRAVESHKRVLLGVVKLAAGSDQPPGILDEVSCEMLHEVGTLGAVVRLLKLGDGTLRMLVQGIERVQLDAIAAGPGGLTAAFTPVRDTVGDPLRTEALRRQVTDKMQRIIQLAPNLAGEMREVLEGITDAGKLADFCAANLSLDVEVKAQLLGTGDVTARLDKLTALLDREIQVLEVGTQIQEKLKSRLDDHQREYVLREQLRLIRRSWARARAAHRTSPTSS